VCRADQCIGPGPKSWDSPIPTGNCGPVSSDIHMLDRHVRILYEFMFYIYINFVVSKEAMWTASDSRL
jgi:hypothetical protein